MIGTVAKIQNARGSVTTLRATQSPAYFIRSYGKHGQRLTATAAASELRSFQFECEHNGSKMLEIDTAAAAAILAAHPE